MKRLLHALALISAWVVAEAAEPQMPPRPGDIAPNFTLNTLENKPIELRNLTAAGPVVLLVLRGWPEYQCPLCTKQVQDYIAHAPEFSTRGVRVLMVYPGPAERLLTHAQEFLRDKAWPANFTFVIDPDYGFTNAYGLRWNAKRETAYPSTFVLEKDGRVQFAHVSKSHGDRVGASKALAELK